MARQPINGTVSWVLGSKSPRRQELLKAAGFDFVLRTADADESFPSSMKGIDVPAFLSQIKSKAISIEEGECLITADTVVCIGDTILNKAADAGEAREMLELLSGTDHWVHTGVTLRSIDKQVSFTESTRVFFKTLSKEEIDFYIREYKPFDKAGAYGIQEWIGYRGVSRIEGCYYNVVGFPVARFVKEAEKFI